MDEVAHQLVPLLHTLGIVDPDSHALPPYKTSYPPDAPLLPFYSPKAFLLHRDAETHLQWGLRLASLALDYLYPPPTRPHRFMQL